VDNTNTKYCRKALKVDGYFHYSITVKLR